MTSVKVYPNRMPEIPAYAMKKILSIADLNVDQIDVIEINEAFAAVPLVSIDLLVDRDKSKAKTVQTKTNINRSAIAIGHPNTASGGAQVIMSPMYELQRRGGGYAMGAICGGLAQADVCIIKV